MSEFGAICRGVSQGGMTFHCQNFEARLPLAIDRQMPFADWVSFQITACSQTLCVSELFHSEITRFHHKGLSVFEGG